MLQLLHGTLIVDIFDLHMSNQGCVNLCRKSGKRILGQVKKMMLCQPEFFGSRLYATVDLDRARVARTRLIENKQSNLKCNEHFRIYCAHSISHIIFTVKEADHVGATVIGRAYLPVDEVSRGFVYEKWVDILDQDLNITNSFIRVKLQFLSVSQDLHWSLGIKTPNFEGVPYTFFKQRRGCKVSLYQDAHVPNDFSPLIQLTGGNFYEPQRCWKDIFDAINNARHLIYIAGWSVYSGITLIRDPNVAKLEEVPTLGKLLKKKAEEGVTVLILVWDDTTSVKELKRDGLMATHDEDTEKYFQGSKVHCRLCPRNPDNGRSIVQGIQISHMFTHHQKTIVVDKEVAGGGLKRRIVSFIGGIDLCDGRYDTPEHPVFSTLSTIHRNDFHQPNFRGASINKGGPREPWHDIHCKLEGPVAWDVLYNFEQRWHKQFGDTFLIPMRRINEILTHPSPVTNLDDPETWNVQLFRSIDGGAAHGFPENPEEAALLGLVSGKDNVIDRSIQDAYINAIRRAKHFIYIENQYFLGSSYGWKSNDIKVENIGALHLIPKEISLKIVSKIEAGERFAVYIVIPMWPEGIPDSASVQAILDWQRRTMEMMYLDITQALSKKDLSADPREYLNFYCLGNREAMKPGEYVPPEKPEPDTDYLKAQQARRFMIYVHAKMMIVDDEYIIIGSANINQRSMDGGRDTEIAMGAFQPHHIIVNDERPRGQIFGFRMELWFEHTHSREGLFFQNPESLECVHEVNKFAKDNWELYTRATLDADMQGHLLPYPIQVPKDFEENIRELPLLKFFPDTRARILGGKSDVLPSILTT